jgi:hypothetical protein
MFGWRRKPIDRDIPVPAVDSDGKRRVFGEAVFAGEHGDMLRALGFGLDDPANIVPDAAEFDRRLKESFAKQDARRTEIEDDLMRAHGHNAIRPFFILADPVFNSELGSWLIRLMNLMPYDDWNVVYLPLDRETQAAMGGLPLHPRQSIAPIDELMVKQIGDFYTHYKSAKGKVDERVRKVGIAAASDVLNEFVTYADVLPQRILDHVARVRPLIVELIADVQRQSERG